MGELPAEFERALNEVYGPIEAMFSVEQTPQGGAPEEVRNEWVGVSLPVRAVHLIPDALVPSRNWDHLREVISENDDPIRIVGTDAVQALLDANRDRAADYWLPLRIANFVFRAHEGTLTPVETSPES